MDAKQFDELLRRRRTNRNFAREALPRHAIDRLLWAAQGVTHEDGRRTAPSAQALHPIRLSVTAGNISGLEAGIYEARANNPTRLELRVAGDHRWRLKQAALDDQPWIATAAAVISVCANLATSAQAFAGQPPYGSRGLRYAYIEAGAVSQNIQLHATAAGYSSVLVAGFRDETTNDVLGLSAPVSAVLHVCVGIIANP